MHSSTLTSQGSLTKRPYFPLQNAKREGAPSEILSPSSAGPRGVLFLVLVWATFVLPNANWAGFPFVIGHTNFSELALILMPFVYALYPRQRAVWHTRRLRIAVLAFFGACILGNALQYGLYGGNTTSFFRVHRPLIPLYCAMALLYLGPRIRPKLLISNLGLCLSVSFFVSLVFFLFDLQFEPIFQAELTEGAYEIIRSGRLYNVNADFAYLGLAIIAAFSYHQRGKKLDLSTLLLMLTCVLSVFTSILTFNRTFLIIAPSLIIVALVLFFRFRVVLYFILTVSLAVSLGLYSYHKFSVVRWQVDKRLVIPLKHQEMVESIYYGNRDILYDGYLDVGKRYFSTGVPPDVPWKVAGMQSRESRTTDISFATVTLRNGILAFLCYLWVGWMFYGGVLRSKSSQNGPWTAMLKGSILMSMPFMVLASLNTDILARHYSVVLLVLLSISLSDNQ